jgi:hypothetical protein
MATATDEVTVDLAALDAAAAEKAKKAEKTPENASGEPTVVVDPELAAKTGAAAAVSPDEGIEKLKKQLETEREAREAAETRARQAAQGEAEARGRVQSTELDLIKNAIATVTQANDALEAKYAEAMAAQDWVAAAKAQREMGLNSAKLVQLEAGKTQLEKAPKPTPRAPADPVEQYIANVGPEYPRSQEWLRAHPQFVRDKNKNQQMIAAHQLALARGYKPDTDEYFKSIEKTLDLTPAPTNGANGAHVETDPVADPSASAATGGRQMAPAAAPVSRSGTGNGGSRPNTVKLTLDQIEMAHASFPDSKTPLEDYARQLVALRKEGKLS